MTKTNDILLKHPHWFQVTGKEAQAIARQRNEALVNPGKNGGNLGKINDTQWFRLNYKRGSDFLSILNLVQADNFRALIWGLSPFRCREPFPRPKNSHVTARATESSYHFQPRDSEKSAKHTFNLVELFPEILWSIMKHYEKPLSLAINHHHCQSLTMIISIPRRPVPTQQGRQLSPHPESGNPQTPMVCWWHHALQHVSCWMMMGTMGMTQVVERMGDTLW